MKIREIIAENSQVDEAFGLGTLSKIASKPFVQRAAQGTSKFAGQAAQAKNDISIISKAFAHLGSKFIQLLSAIGIATIVVKTYLNIRELNKQYESKQISPADYEEKLQAELGYAATQIVAAGAVKGIISLGGAAISTFPLLGWLGKLVRAASGPATAAFLGWLQTPDGSKLFAQWFIGAIMEGGFTGVAVDFISSYTKKAYDAIMMRTKEAAQNTASKSVDATGTDSSTEPANGEEFFKKFSKDNPASDAQEFDSATGTWLNKPKS